MFNSDIYDDDNSTDDSGSYVGGPYDITTMMDSPDPGSGDTIGGSGFFTSGRPRSDAESVDIGRDRGTGEFTMEGGDPVPLERDADSGRVGPDPYAIGNFGEFNSPYSTEDKEEDKYG